MKRVAFLSFHTCPLIPPGTGDAGGMNVYIDELATAMVSHGIDVDVFTRRTGIEDLGIVEAPGGYRVVHITAGPPEKLGKVDSARYVAEFADAVVATGSSYDLVHSHYWLSGWAGLLVKRSLGVPLANSFHTLGRVKDQNRRADEPPESLLRIAAEHDVLAGSDCVIASTPAEAEALLHQYGADPARLCVSPPGLNHEVFSPGDRARSRAALGISNDADLVVFAGRIQPLKGVDVAVDAFTILQRRLPDARLMIVGGPSGPLGEEAVREARGLVDQASLGGAVDFIDPVAHSEMVTYYRAADVLLVPSRSESFGLVAVEAQACGLPVVAANVGGLSYAVADTVSGFLVDGWDPGHYAHAMESILTDTELAESLSKGALEHSERYSWESAVGRLFELYRGITSAA